MFEIISSNSEKKVVYLFSPFHALLKVKNNNKKKLYVNCSIFYHSFRISLESFLFVPVESLLGSLKTILIVSAQFFSHFY